MVHKHGRRCTGNSKGCPLCHAALLLTMDGRALALRPHSVQQVGSLLPCRWLQFLPANPGPWSVCEGTGWVELASLPHISYGVAHMYATMRQEGRAEGRAGIS